VTDLIADRSAPVEPGSAALVDGEPPHERRASGWDRLRPGRLSVRTRILLIFAFGSLLLTAFLAITTYTFLKSTLLEERDEAGLDAAYTDARRVLTALRSNPTTLQPLLVRLGGDTSLVLYRGEWTASDPRFGPDQVPAALQERVLVDRVPARMITEIHGTPVLAVGIPLPEVGATYFEFVPLDDVSSTLRNVSLSLAFGGLITLAIGLALGALAARRVLRPVGQAAQAARTIAGGRLDTRLEPTDDPDLALLANAFNDMAAALEARVERDARFASDVSHELRSPLMTLSASVEVMQSRREELPERAQAALDLLTADVARFQGLVEDLLEISRFDAGAIRLHREELLAGEFVRQAVAVSSLPQTPVLVSPRAEHLLIHGDRRRLARVIANLIDNGRIHGGGDVEIAVIEAEGDTEPLSSVWIVVEDHGTGVASEDRDLIFERFARGGSAGRRGVSEGAGLGLALVDEHVRLHGGRVWVEDREDAEPGARFVVELPAEELGDE
jgi:signal transduction histidine kinase